jgi:hypothetical protein
MLLNYMIAIYVGLMINTDMPLTPKDISVTHRQKQTRSKSEYIFHKAKLNEGLWQIASVYKVTKNVQQWVEIVAQINDLRILDSQGNYVIETDQVIKIPRTWH